MVYLGGRTAYAAVFELVAVFAERGRAGRDESCRSRVVVGDFTPCGKNLSFVDQSGLTRIF